MKSIFKAWFLLLLLCFLVVSCVPATETSQSNSDIAYTFVKARETWNPQLLDGLFADNLTSFDATPSADEFPELFAYYKSINWVFKAGDCTEATTTLVKCNAQLSNAWTLASNSGPYDMVFDITVENSKITIIRPLWNMDFINTHLVPFMEFVEQKNPDDLAIIRGSGQHFFPKGEEAIELLKTYTADFIATR